MRSTARVMENEATEVNASVRLLRSAAATGSISPTGWRGAEPQCGRSGLCRMVRTDVARSPAWDTSWVSPLRNGGTMSTIQPWIWLLRSWGLLLGDGAEPGLKTKPTALAWGSLSVSPLGKPTQNLAGKAVPKREQQGRLSQRHSCPESGGGRAGHICPRISGERGRLGFPAEPGTLVRASSSLWGLSRTRKRGSHWRPPPARGFMTVDTLIRWLRAPGLGAHEAQV